MATYKYVQVLRAKAFEVKAVRVLRNQLTASGKILPVFEPVVDGSKSLVAAAADFSTAGLAIAVVYNPQHGVYKGRPHDVAKLVTGLHAAGVVVVPSLWIGPTTTVNEIKLVGTLASGPVLIVHGHQLNAAGMAALPTRPAPSNALLDGGASAQYQAQLRSPRGLIRDGFKSQAKNASYPPRSFFSDLHLNYAAGGFAFFGDFSIVGDRYSPSGGPAYAVAIHMTEDGRKTGIHCNHFLSTTNNTVANPAKKFAEALQALHAYAKANPGRIDFSLACRELLTHRQNGHFPGLGEVKRLCIQHHLELMLRLV